MTGSTLSPRYTRVAVILHWLIALAIIGLLAAGKWMVGAVEEPETRNIAFKVYQLHKSLGVTVLLLTLLRLGWRLLHKAPPLPAGMPAWQVRAAKASHHLFYVLMLAAPLTGWAMVSASPLGFPTIVFGLFEWPHIAPLTRLEDKAGAAELLSEVHEQVAHVMILLIVLHIAAALKHHYVDRDGLLGRMIPWMRQPGG